MYRYIAIIFTICFLCLSLTACGPSEEKMTAAQQKYTELVEMHNQVVDAHNKVSDGSLDQSLTELQEQITVIEGYDLTEMKDEEIDGLIDTMDSLIDSYNEFLVKLTEILEKENAEVITTIPVTVINNTGFTISSLTLKQKGDTNHTVNILDELSDLVPEQSLTGLMIYRNTQNTPWILTVSDAEDNAFELTLSVEEFSEEGVHLSLIYDSEVGELLIE